MKKRLLITSIVMMLVVAVALSTATYAWFTSATQVTAQNITMTAGSSDSSALGIAWATSSGTPNFNAGYGTTITAKAPTLAGNGFQPAAPTALTDSEPSFYTQKIDAQGNFKAAGVGTTVYRFTENVDNTPSTLIHIANLAQSGTKSVVLTAAITDPTSGANDGTALIRIAAYVVTSGTNYTYKGVLSAASTTNNTAVGTITGPTTVEQVTTQQAASSLLTVTSTAASQGINLGNVAPQTEMTVAIYVWLDGAAFDEAQSGKSANIALTFTAAAEQPTV